MKEKLKKIFFSQREKYVYRRYIKKWGLSFIEYRSFVNNLDLVKDDTFETILLNKKIIRPNVLSYVQCFWEIFIDEVYYFKTENKSPIILDCGSNIGLSIIYFKQLYPNAKVIGFEADPSIYNICCDNLKQFNFTDVTLVNAAIWSSDGFISFKPNNSMGGRIDDQKNGQLHSTVDVKTLNLRSYLNQKIDFLKIDIEGSEAEVIEGCKDLLHNVEFLFVEYHSDPSIPKQNLDQILKNLKEAGFRYYIKEAYPVMHNPYKDIENRERIIRKYYFDLQLNIFAYR